MCVAAAYELTTNERKKIVKIYIQIFTFVLFEVKK